MAEMQDTMKGFMTNLGNMMNARAAPAALPRPMPSFPMPGPLPAAAAGLELPTLPPFCGRPTQPAAGGTPITLQFPGQAVMAQQPSADEARSCAKACQGAARLGRAHPGLCY